MEVFFLCKTSSRPSGSVPSAPSTSLFAETSLGVSLPGSSSSSSSLPLGGQGKRGGVWGAPSVFMGYFLPSRSTLVRREGRWCLWAFVCRVRARSFFSSSFGGWGRGSWLSCCRRPFPASPRLLTLPNSHRTFHDVGIWGSLQSLAPAFLSSRESRSSERGSRVDKRARSREVSSRGRRCRSRSLSSYRSRFSGCERGRRSSSASRSSRGRSCCERSRSSDRCRSQRGSSRSRRAWSRSSDRYRSRRDLSRCARSRSLAAAAPTVTVRVFPACRGVRRVRSQSHALPHRSLDRSRSCVRLPASPARLRSVEAGRLARRGPQEGVGAFVSQPPVAWCSGGRPSCSGGASIAALPSVFFQELAKFVMSLSGSSSLGASGVLAGVTASAAASWGIACPASAAAGAATLCAATVTPAGAGVFACCSRCCSWRVW